MKSTLKKAFVYLLAVALLVPVFCVPSSARTPLAYNIYSNPTGVPLGWNAFTIDFMSTETPNYTYWALANFSVAMTKESKVTYRSLSGGGAYAGLQNRAPTATQGFSGIMSFWEWFYTDSNGEQQSLRATRIYPKGSSEFGGEGEGTNIIAQYNWQPNKWYRMYLKSWVNPETKTTYVGQWFLDIEAGEWTLFSYFDTHMINSYLTGNAGLFMENYVSATNTEERDFRTKNIYFMDKRTNEWVSTPSCFLSFGGHSAEYPKIGTHEFGSTDEYFWGKAGAPVENQDEYEKTAQQKAIYSIKQPEQPDETAAPVIKSLTSGDTKKDGAITKTAIRWEMDEKSTPFFSYTLKVTDQNGKELFASAATAPELTELSFENTEAAYKCELTVTDVFGKTATATYTSEAYGEEPAPTTPDESSTVAPTDETTTPDASTSEPVSSSEESTVAPAETETPSADTTPNNDESSFPVVPVVIAVAAVAVIGGGCGVYFATKKKKKQ